MTTTTSGVAAMQAAAWLCMSVHVGVLRRLADGAVMRARIVH